MCVSFCWRSPFFLSCLSFGVWNAQMPKKRGTVTKCLRYVADTCNRLTGRFQGTQISDKTKCDLLESHLTKELLLLKTLDQHYQKYYKLRRKQLQAAFLKEIANSDWFHDAQNWGFTLDRAKMAFLKQKAQESVLPVEEKTNKPEASSRKKKSYRTSKEATKKEQIASRDDRKSAEDQIISSTRATNRRNTGLIAKEWNKFIDNVVKENPEKRTWANSALDLSKAPNRGNHWLFKIFQAFQQVLESLQGKNVASAGEKLNSTLKYQDSPGQWEYLNGAFGLPKEKVKLDRPHAKMSTLQDACNRLPSSFVRWNKIVLQFFSQPSAHLAKEMPMIIQQLQQSVFVSPIQRAHAVLPINNEENLRECIAEFLKAPSWPPLWLTCWVGHLILLTEDSEWKREPRHLAVELNEKDTYFFYVRGGWQNHWAEERDGLAAAGKGVLCCAWDSKASFLSIFAPSPALWSCRLATVYLLKRGRSLFGNHPRYGDLVVWKKKSTPFCESRYRDVEILNIFSSGFYLLVACFFFLRARTLNKKKHNSVDFFIFAGGTCSILFFLGLFSALFHATLYTVWGKADCFCIVLLVLWVQLYLCLRIFRCLRKREKSS